MGECVIQTHNPYPSTVKRRVVPGSCYLLVGMSSSGSLRDLDVLPGWSHLCVTSAHHPLAGLTHPPTHPPKGRLQHRAVNTLQMLVNNINKIPPCFASTDMHEFQLCQWMSLPTSCSNCRHWSALTVIAWSTSPAAIWTRLWGTGIYLIWSPYISFHAKKVCVINVNYLLRHQHASHEANSVSAPGQDQLYHFFSPESVCDWLLHIC